MKAYRYNGYVSETFFDTNSNIYCQVFPVIRTTPKGFWINEWGKERFMYKQSASAYARLTKEQAWKDYVIRKKRQLAIVEAQVRYLTTTLAAVKDLSPKDIAALDNCELDKFMQLR